MAPKRAVTTASCKNKCYIISLAATQHERHLFSVNRTGTVQGSVTSWSSWRSFTVTLLRSSGRLPLAKTPSLVITTGWRTLKSRATAVTPDGTRAEGSDTVTISISASCPVAGTRGRHLLQPRRADRLFPAMRGGRRWGAAPERHHQQFEELFPGTAVFNLGCSRSWGWLLNYDEQFITRGINERIKAPKREAALFTLQASSYTSSALPVTPQGRRLEVRAHRQRGSSALSNQMFLTLTKWNRAGRFSQCVTVHLLFLVHKCQNN